MSDKPDGSEDRRLRAVDPLGHQKLIRDAVAAIQATNEQIGIGTGVARQVQLTRRPTNRAGRRLHRIARAINVFQVRYGLVVALHIAGKVEEAREQGKVLEVDLAVLLDELATVAELIDALRDAVELWKKRRRRRKR